MGTIALVGAMVTAVPAGAGGDDASSYDEQGPKQGVTYSGQVDGFSVRLTALAPVGDGSTQALAHLRLECDKASGPRGVDETLPTVIATDGTFEVDKTIRESGGGTFEVDMHVEGRFTDPASTEASYSYDLYDEDDDGNTSACDDKGELELDGGRVDPGLERVEVAIPVEPTTAVDADDSEALGGPMAASTDAVYALIGNTLSDGPDVSDLFRIDPATNVVTAHQEVPIDLDGLVVAGSGVWAIDADGGTLVPIDPSTLTPGSPVQIAPARDPGVDEDWALSPSGAVVDGSIWLAATRDQQVVRVDAATGTVATRAAVDAHPQAITAGPTGLYVETQTRPLFSAPSGQLPTTNLITRLDPTTGETLATSAAYPDGSISSPVATADAVVISVSGVGSSEDQLVALDPETLETDETAKLQYPVAAAPPSVWTLTPRNVLRGLEADLTPDIQVREVSSDTSDAGVGFDAIWVYNATQRSIYRISTTS